MTFLLILSNFNHLRRLEVFFLAFYSRFHGRHYLALFRKLRLKLQEVTSLAQHEKFHMANFHMDSTSSTVFCCYLVRNNSYKIDDNVALTGHFHGLQQMCYNNSDYYKLWQRVIKIFDKLGKLVQK